MANAAKKIAFGTSIMYSQSILNMFLGAASTVLIIRYLGQYQYGLLILVLAIVGMVAPFLDFGISQVISADLANDLGKKKFDRVKRLIRDYIIVEVVISLILFLAIFASAFLAKSFYGEQKAELLRIASFLVLTSGLSNIFGTIALAYSKFIYLALVEILENLIRLFLVFVLLFWLKLDTLGALLISLGTALSGIIISFPLLWRLIMPLRKYKISSEPILKNLILGHGKFQILIQPLKDVSENARSWIIAYLVGVNAVALYQVGYKIYNYLIKFLGSLEGVLVPVFSEEASKDEEIAKKIILRSTKYATWIAISIMIAGYFFVPYLLKLFFGDKYIASIPLFWIFILSLPAVGIGIILRPVFFYLKEQKHLLTAHIITLIISFSLGIIFTIFWGVTGWAITVPLGSYLSLTIRYKFLSRIKKAYVIDFVEILRWDKYDTRLLKKIYRRILRIKPTSLNEEKG